MKRIFNFRPTVILAICFMIAIALSVCVFTMHKTRTIFIIFCVTFSVILFIFGLIFRRKFVKFLSVCLIFMMIPAIIISAKSIHFNRNLYLNNKDILISGLLDGDYSFTTKGMLELVLRDVEVNDDNKVTLINDKVIIYTSPENIDLSNLESGVKLNVKTNLEFFDLNGYDKKDLSYINNGIIARGFARFYDIEITDKCNKTLRDKIHDKVHDVIYDSGINNPDIAYAMMFGESDALDGAVEESFRNTGIAHLIAVSGLHISIIAAVLGFVLKKLKVSAKSSLIMFGLVLSFYCYLCDFSPSVIRASLMAVFSMYAVVRGKAYDSLSVLSLVAIIVLMIDPLQMFDVSFVLSFAAVLSIILFAGVLTRIFERVFYKKFASTLAINLAVQVGLFAANIYYFGKFPLLGIFANLVAIPLSTIAFVILIVGVLLSVVMPFMSFVNFGFDLPMTVIVKFNAWVSRIGLNLSLGSIPFAVILLMFLFMFILSDYLFVKRKIKFLTASAVVVLAGILIFV